MCFKSKSSTNYSKKGKEETFKSINVKMQK